MVGCGVLTWTTWWVEGSYDGPAVTRRRYLSAITVGESRVDIVCSW